MLVDSEFGTSLTHDKVRLAIRIIRIIRIDCAFGAGAIRWPSAYVNWGVSNGRGRRERVVQLKIWASPVTQICSSTKGGSIQTIGIRTCWSRVSPTVRHDLRYISVYYVGIQVAFSDPYLVQASVPKCSTMNPSLYH